MAFHSSDTPSESPRKKKAEKIRLRAIEFDNLLKELENDSMECNKDMRCYGRKLLYCIGDIEKEFKHTLAPLEVLEAYGIDIHSMPDQKRKKFNPSWIKNTAGESPKKKEKGVPFSRRAENAWKSDRNNNSLLKSVRSILNKITVKTKDELTEDFLNLHVSGELPQFNAPDGQLAQVVDILFAKAISEPQYCPLYVGLCKRQFDMEVRLAERSPFGVALVTKCHNTRFSKALEASKIAIENEMNEERRENMIVQFRQDLKIYKLGNTKFMEELYNQYVVRTALIQLCLYELIKQTIPRDKNEKLSELVYNEEEEANILCAAKLIEGVGRKFENCTDLEGASSYLSSVIDHLLKIARRCPLEIQFKILEIKELRDNNWMKRTIVVGGISKTIAEIHKETEPSGALRPPRRFHWPKYKGAVPSPPRSTLKYDVLETLARLRKQFSHDKGCGKSCTTRCPRMRKTMELASHKEFWSEVEEFYPSVADQIKEDIDNLQSAQCEVIIGTLD